MEQVRESGARFIFKTETDRLEAVTSESGVMPQVGDLGIWKDEDAIHCHVEASDMDELRRQWVKQSPGDRCARSAKLTSHAQATAESPSKKKKEKKKERKGHNQILRRQTRVDQSESLLFK